MPHHILVVEDDDSLSTLYGIYLERGQYNYTLVSFVDQALKVLAEETIDLILVDINLNEDMNGIDLIRKIREDEKNTDLAVLIVTSFPERFENLTELRVAKVLKKPVKYLQFMDAVKQALDMADSD